MDQINPGDYQVALSPDLDITPEEFARAWNEDAETREHATAYFTDARAAKFLDPSLLVAAMLSVPANVASAALYDLIKGVVERLRKEKGQPQAPRKHIHFEQTTKPDGTVIIAIDYDE
jgi:hypothetical protein